MPDKNSDLTAKDSETRKTVQELCLGFAGSGFIIVTQICTREVNELDFWLSWSVRVFAFTIPLLLGYWHVLDHDFELQMANDPNNPNRQYLLAISFIFVCIVHAVGLALFFGHFGWSTFCAFLLGVACLIAWLNRVTKRVNKAIKETAERIEKQFTAIEADELRIKSEKNILTEP